MIYKFIEYIGFAKILDYLLEIFEFYFTPFKFFNKFFSKSLHEKLTQTIFYAIFWVGVGYILIKDITFKELAKAILFETYLLIWVILILISTEFIVARIQKRNIRYSDIIFYPIIIKLFIAPWQVIFFGLFIFFEDYNYLLLSNTIIILSHIYMLVLSGFVFHKKFYAIFFILLNIISLNLLYLIRTNFSIDSYSSYDNPYIDQIGKERYEKGQALKDIFKVPTHQVLRIYKDQRAEIFYLLSTPFDTLARGTQEKTDHYRESIKANIIYLDTVKLKFKRNRDLFDKIQILNKKIDSLTKQQKVVYLNEIKADDIVEASIIVDKDSVEVYKEYVLKLPASIDLLNNELISNDIEVTRLSLKSAMPLKALDYLYPMQFLTDNTK